MKKMKKIGIDARFCTISSTGIGRHTEELIRYLAKFDKNNNYTVFLTSKVAPSFKDLPSNFSLETVSIPHYSWQEQIIFPWKLWRGNFDLMVFPHFNFPLLYVRKFVVTIHDLTLHFYPGAKKTSWWHLVAYKFLISQVAKRSEHIFAVSENTKKDLIKLLQISPKKILVTHNGVSDNFQQISSEKIKKFKLKNKLPDKYFLHTGVGRPHKNLVRLIQAFTIFKQQNDKDNKFYLIFTGPSFAEFEEIKVAIDESGFAKFIQHRGLWPEETMNEMVAGATAYIFPTLYEGFGLPPLEAMQCGVPTAVSNVSALPEICGSATIYFDPLKVEKIAEAMNKVASDKKLREKLISSGLKQVKKFSWEKMSQAMWKVYQEILLKK